MKQTFDYSLFQTEDTAPAEPTNVLNFFSFVRTKLKNKIERIKACRELQEVRRRYDNNFELILKNIGSKECDKYRAAEKYLSLQEREILIRYGLYFGLSDKDKETRKSNTSGATHITRHSYRVYRKKQK